MTSEYVSMHGWAILRTNISKSKQDRKFIQQICSIKMPIKCHYPLLLLAREGCQKIVIISYVT